MKTIQNKTKLFFNILILLFISKSINAQSINLIGVELVNDSLKIIEWNNQTPSIYSSVGTSMFTVTMGTSTYNATNATYYVRGLVDSTSDVVMYDATTNVQQIVDISSFYSPSIESDMSTGLAQVILSTFQMPLVLIQMNIFFILPLQILLVNI